jgi:hypothetical protein
MMLKQPLQMVWFQDGVGRAAGAASKHNKQHFEHADYLHM